MQKAFILFSLIILVVSVSAQTRFGIKAGIDFANQTDGYGNFSFSSPPHLDIFSSQSRTGFHTGFFADIPLGPVLIFRPQLLYTVGGGRIPITADIYGTLASPAFSYSMRYIQLPFQLLFSPSCAWGRPWVGIGPYGGILLGSKVTEGNVSISVPIGSGVNDGFKRFDLGIEPTLGIAFKNGLLFGADYQLGMVNVNPNGGGYGPFPDTKVKNRIWSVYAGYTWKP